MSVHKKPGGEMNRDRYSELKRILEERRREIMEQVQEKIRDVRAEGANNPNQGVLDAVESSEAEYVASIEKLAAVARPLLDDPRSPLVASYREKLQLLDAAIVECRGAIERNRFNAHLRRELLSIYQEKQRTLSALLEEERT